MLQFPVSAVRPDFPLSEGLDLRVYFASRKSINMCACGASTLTGTQNMLNCAAVYRIVLDTSLASYDGEGGRSTDFGTV